MKSLLTICLTAALSSSTAGCFWVTTKAEGNKTRKEVKGIDGRVETLEEGMDAKMKKLQSVLDEATKLLTRNSADIGNEVKSLESDMRQLRGLINEAHRNTETMRKDVTGLKKYGDLLATLDLKLKDLETRLLAVEQRSTQPVTQSASELYNGGMAAHKDGDHATARKLFKRLVIRFPGHEKADDAQYYRGESYFKQKDYDAAIREYQKVWDKFEKSSRADDALFRAAEAAEKLKHCREARAYHGELRNRYPSSSLAKKSLARAKELKKNAKNRKRCIK